MTDDHGTPDKPSDLGLHRLARHLREALPGIEVSVGDEPPDLTGHRVIEGPRSGRTPDDLVAFLLARYAEAELIVRAAVGSSAGARLTWNRIEVWTADSVLADIAVKRRIVELHGHRPEQAWDGSTLTGDCRECTDEHYPCATLRLLGLEHADHPDYREEWKP